MKKKIKCIAIHTADGTQVYPLHRNQNILDALYEVKDYPECLEPKKKDGPEFEIVYLTRNQWAKAKKIGRELY